MSATMYHRQTSLVAQMAKYLPAMWETQVHSLGQEDSLKKGMQPTPVFLPGEFRGQRSLVGYSPGGRRVRRDRATNTFTFFIEHKILI